MPTTDVSREEVHEALSHLYENDLLVQTPLTARIPGVAEVVPLQKRAERMRAFLLEAIEVFRPSRRPAFGSADSRHYDVLCLHYVEEMPVTRMQEELSIGRRQLHRDLFEAEARLAEMIAFRIRASGATPSSPGKDPLADELMLLNSQLGRVDLEELVRSVLRLLQPLAQRLGVGLLQADDAPEPAYALADRAILRQLLVQFIAYAIQSAAYGDVTVSVDGRARLADIAIRFAPREAPDQRSVLADARRIALSQQIHTEVIEGAAEATIALHLCGARVGSVLVVEDNLGALELYRRYLSPAGWRVEGVSDPRQACELAASLRPDAIILDIMMPGLDGWGVLESLAASPETAAIPVLICSVVQDVRLGEALGARAYLHKPVARGELLAALSRCLPPRRECP